MQKNKNQRKAAQKAQKTKTDKMSVGVGGMKAVPVPLGYSTRATTSLGAEIRVAHREFLGNISGNSSSFLLLGASATIPGYDLNPANSLAFPWLSMVAEAYEKFRFERVRYELVPRNSATSPGTAFMAFDYDYDDPVAYDAKSIMVNRGAVSGSVWTPLAMDVDCMRVNEDVPWRYCDSVLRSASTGRLSYGGYVMVAIAGTTGSVAFDLFVDYEVRLSLPGLHHENVEHYSNLPEDRTLGVGTFESIPVLPNLGPSLPRVPMVDVPTPGGSIPLGNGYAYDLISTAAHGLLTLVAKPATAGSPPSAFAADTSMSAQVRDSKGTVLTDNLFALLGTNSVKQGANNPAEWGTNDKQGMTIWTLALDALRGLYPTAKYLIPYLQSVAGRVLSTDSLVYGKYVEL